MFAKTLTAIAATAAALGAMVPAAAQAQRWDRQPGYGRYYEPVQYRGDRRWNDGRRYDNRRYYQARNSRGGNRCYDKGNGGLAIGGIAGGLLGNEIAGRGGKTLGAVLGAAAGALAGRAIDRSDGRRC